MTGISSIPVIQVGTDGNGCAVTGQGDVVAPAVVTSCLSINVTTNLIPGAAVPLVNP